MNALKYMALPTWFFMRLLISSMPTHPYNKFYPDLLTWVAQSLPIFRLFDICLWLSGLSLLSHLFQ